MTDSNTSVAPSTDAPIPTFADFGLYPQLLQAVVDPGYTTHTPIQAQALPAVMAGRDVMGAAQTGTGKTADFTMPIMPPLMPQAQRRDSPARHPARPPPPPPT